MFRRTSVRNHRLVAIVHLWERTLDEASAVDEETACSRWNFGFHDFALRLFLSPLSYRKFHRFLWSSKRPGCIRDTLERRTFPDVGETFRAPVPFVLRRVVMGLFMPWLSSWQRSWSQTRLVVDFLLKKRRKNVQLRRKILRSLQTFVSAVEFLWLLF